MRARSPTSVARCSPSRSTMSPVPGSCTRSSAAARPRRPRSCSARRCPTRDGHRSARPSDVARLGARREADPARGRRVAARPRAGIGARRVRAVGHCPMLEGACALQRAGRDVRCRALIVGFARFPSAWPTRRTGSWMPTGVSCSTTSASRAAATRMKDCSGAVRWTRARSLAFREVDPHAVHAHADRRGVLRRRPAYREGRARSASVALRGLPASALRPRDRGGRCRERLGLAPAHPSMPSRPL